MSCAYSRKSVCDYPAAKEDLRMTSDGRARTRVEAMSTLPQNIGHLRTGSLFQDASSSRGNKIPSFSGRRPADAPCQRFFVTDPPQSEALGTAHSMRRLLNGHSNHQANGSEICKSIEAVDTFWNLQFCKWWSPANSFGGRIRKSGRTRGLKSADKTV